MQKPLEVEVNGNVEKALRKLKKMMGYEGVFRELKKRRFYEKPSDKRKRKKEEAERRRLKKIRRMKSNMVRKKYINRKK